MSLLDLIYPKYCLECRRKGSYICMSCLSKVSPGNFRNAYSYSIWAYEGVIRKAILALKYRFAKDIAKELGLLAASELKNRSFNIPNAILVPIPLHQRRTHWRGFNQSAEIGKIVAVKMHWQFIPDLLIKNISTQPQAQLKREERLKNLHGAFSLNPKHNLQNTTCIVFDDVATTGATLSEASKALVRCERRIICLTLAS